MPQYLMSVWFDDEYESEPDRTDPDIVRTERAGRRASTQEMSERPAPGCSSAACTPLVGHGGAADGGKTR